MAERIIDDFCPVFDPQGLPQSRPVVITIFARVVCTSVFRPSIRTFQNRPNQNKSLLAEWIIDDSCLVLANSMFKFQITPVLPLDMMWMRPVFPNLSPKTLEELGCDPDIKFKFTKRNELWNSNNVEDLRKHYGNEKHFTIQKYSNDFKLLAQYSDELKHEFEFNSTYQKQSKEFLIKVKHKHLTKLRVKEKDLRSLNFIGVHVRRTDYGGKFI